MLYEPPLVLVPFRVRVLCRPIEDLVCGEAFDFLDIVLLVSYLLKKL